MLQYIKKKNENIQIIAVGDMEQKIYDKTTLDVMKFIDEFLDDYTRMSFTNCFRLSKDLAARLGRIWSKNIIGVNENCKIVSMNVNEVTRFLLDEAPEDILCLGARTGTMVDVLNILEKEKPDKFNKKTVYASIKESDSVGKIEPKSNSAIFTTYDSSKGLERKICVVFDYTESYWAVRSSHPMQKYEILRNIFCVAASRGKNVIVFVDEDESALSEETMSCNFETSYKFDNVGISTMFEFKYKEDIEECYNLLKLEEIINEDCNIIDIKSSDELIDLSPCIGIYQKVCFFTYKDIDKDIKLVFDLNKNLFYNKNILKKNTIDQKILYLTSLNTKQQRYVNQVIPPFVSEDDSNRIKNRLAQHFSREEDVQIDCRIEFRESDSAEVSFEAVGFADVVKNNIVYVIKFVGELSHENFLECACYMIALKLEKGVLLNTRNNQMYELEIPNKNEFMNAVVKTITKGKIKRYYSDYS